ncbi:nitrogen permease regulator 2 domain-containing protein [Hirsutella rhossiliensis]|uniref:Nitrogen permease regulator 2 domain-containing protein n=1 Tax=Hirsutella rhossiliensis TaxID=111463 RepID=A0A9P8MW34_9HYPO|nr:nitrogen permease regulator 2 domain-containing protein [Hirsutella rhossiliensis]KAH0962335.1 nitrogen permease regulator 2 domain-containing protein [Hirsutella rhossiliensis]
MIQGIFYARFFPKEGPHIVAQSPPGCVTQSDGSRQPLFDFDVLQEYIIPRQAFCNRYVTINTPDGKYTILGHPVVIADVKYRRNEFIFNFGLIVEADVDHTPYERVVRCLATTFNEMERQDEYLSRGESRGQDDARRPIASLLEIIKEDLNNYGECMIPVDDANTINMKLFPNHPIPPVVQGWHVPVAKTKFADIVDPTWDLTLQKVIAKIDGVSDVRRIAHEAGVALDLAKTALRHLLYYDTILLLDMFFFASCYAPRPGIHDFIRNVDGMVDECAGYVSHGRVRVANYHLIKLLTNFSQGKSIKEWIMASNDNGFDVLTHVDVRRFVQFGVIKGCLYRIHKYVMSKQYLAALATGQSRPEPGGDSLQKYTDGNHHFDQIITEKNLTDGEIMDKLKALPVPKGDLTVMYR